MLQYTAAAIEIKNVTAYSYLKLGLKCEKGPGNIFFFFPKIDPYIMWKFSKNYLFLPMLEEGRAGTG